MRSLLAASALLLSLVQLYAQDPARIGRVTERIAGLQASGTRFEPVQLFHSMAPSPGTDALWMEACTRADVLQFDPQAAARLLAAAPEHIALEIPYAGGTWSLHLQRANPFADDLILNVEGSGAMPLPAGLHYRGVIQGSQGSIAAVSIFEHEVMGILSDHSGERILGRFDRAPAGLHVLYHEDDLRGRSGAVCSTVDDGHSYTQEELTPVSGDRTIRCVRFFWEVAYDIVQNKGSVANATNYTTGLFNQSAILYDNDGIDVVLSEILVWAVPSPYTATSSFGRLQQFGDVRTSFNGDLAHLLDLGNYGGVAWLNTLCAGTSFRMAYSGITSSYANVPTYSWSVEVVTHEQGHNLGSKHTHACAWNGNNTAIDGCGQVAGYSEGSCPTGPIPTSSVGGTIMSYCHLTSSTIKFVNGFGPQPTTLMTNLVNNAPCLLICGSTCNAPVVSAVPATTTATVSWSNVGATSYDLQWRLTSTTGWTLVGGLTGTSHLLTGLAEGTSYDYRIMAHCGDLSSGWSATQSFTTILPCVDPFEPNNTLATATDITLPASLNALIGSSSDVDYYRITLDQTANLLISLSNVAADYDLRLLNSAGTQLAISQNGGTNSESINYSNAVAGTYYLHVYGWNGAFNTTQCYLLTASASASPNCGVPSGLAASNITTTSAAISWNTMQAAISYDLQWREVNAVGWNNIPAIAGTTYTLEALLPGTTYSYRVRSNCTGGSSLYGATNSFTTVDDPCYPGVGLALHVWLDGAYDEATQLMRDDLRANGLLPLNEPYSAMGFPVGGELATTPAILSVTGAGAIVDWVLIEIRSASDASQILHTRSGLLRRDGLVIGAAGGPGQINFCLPAGSYHVSVRHRNHLGCMTAAAVSLSPLGSTVDLRSPAQATYGTNAQRVHNGIARLWPGNSNMDQLVKYSGANNDRDPILFAIGGVIPTNTIQGYSVLDANLDGTVKYTGPANDRDLILSTIGGTLPTLIRHEQLP